MSKFIKKAFAFVATLVVALAVATPAFAAGQITIADPVDTNYKAYKIFDAKTVRDAETNTDAIEYTIAADSVWLAKVYNTETGQTRFEGLEFTADNAENPTKYTVAKTVGFDAAEFAKYLKENVPTGAEPKITSEGSSSITGLDSGYYLVICDSDATHTRSMLTTVLGDQNVTIQDKNDMPLDKTYHVGDSTNEVKEGDVQIGDVLTYTITGKVPDTSECESYAYVLTDTMSKGLTFNTSSFKVEIGSGEYKTDITQYLHVITDESTVVTGSSILYYNDGFKLSLDHMQWGQKTHAEDSDNGFQGEPITITYTATVNEDASCEVSENTAVLKFSDNPEDADSWRIKDIETTSYTSRILVDKFEAGAREQKLAGATFILARKNGSTTEYYKFTDDSKVQWVTAEAQATSKTTDTNGSADFIGLENGDYLLYETAAPVGYTPITEPIEITVNGKAATTVGISADQVALALTKVANIANTPGSLLPSTGGMGTTLFYAGSAILLAIIVKRFARSDQEQTA